MYSEGIISWVVSFSHVVCVEKTISCIVDSILAKLFCIVVCVFGDNVISNICFVGI